MSGERPSAPLWPEGISKLRPVGKQKTEALPKGASVPVAKQPELTKPGEQPVQQPGSTPPEANIVYSDEAVSPESKPKAPDTTKPDQATLDKREQQSTYYKQWYQKQKDRRRESLSKTQSKRGDAFRGLTEEAFPFEVPPHPSQTDPNWESYSRKKRDELILEYIDDIFGAFIMGPHGSEPPLQLEDVSWRGRRDRRRSQREKQQGSE